MSITKKLTSAALAILTIITIACSDSSNRVEVTRIVEVTRYFNVTATPFHPAQEATPSPPSLRPQIDTIVEPEPVDQRITFEGYYTTPISTLDPQLTSDAISLTYVENLFVQLTNYDLVTAEVVPEAALGWEITNDGRLYTFYLRSDIPWVYNDPATGETTQEIDEEGNPRFVTAHDFAYSIRRACDPNVRAPFSIVFSPQIVGCDKVLKTENPESISQELIDSIGVHAVDDTTLTIELNFPDSNFLSTTPLGVLSATPSWAIEEHGADWIVPGNVITNGRYVLNEWFGGVRNTLLRNPFMPQDMHGAGNIEKLVFSFVRSNDDNSENNEEALIVISDQEFQTQIDQVIQVFNQPTFYIGFRMTKPPFDNIHVRRAFSAAFDRETFVNDVLLERNPSLAQFAPQDTFGASSLDELSVGFDPVFARAELAAAGYPNSVNFPQITLMADHDALGEVWFEFAESQWVEHLNCDPDQINLSKKAYPIILETISPETADAEVPHMWAIELQPNLIGEKIWVDGPLGCNSPLNHGKRVCNEIDALINQARQEFDLDRRIELYAQIEAAFFGPEGEQPIIPIWTQAAFQAVQPWFDYTPALLGADQWYNYSIYTEAK